MPSVMLSFRVDAEVALRWRVAASLDGKKFGAWLRERVENSVCKGLGSLQEVSDEQQAVETPASGLVDPGQCQGPSEWLEEVHETDAAPGLQAEAEKPLKDPRFRRSPRCMSEKCGRVGVACCGPCRKVNGS